MELTAASTAIVLDSTADFPEAAGRFANWRIVPLYVRFGDESQRDYVDLGPREFYERLRAAPELPTTSQPTPGDFLATYEELAGYDRILSIHLASTLSGTYESARLAAEQLGGDRVTLIDSRTASAAIAMLALAAQRRLARGTTLAEIEELCERYRREAKLLFTVDTLEYLRRGGRIGKAAAMAGNLLNIKPILTIRGGEVVPLKRVRGNQKAFMEFVTQFRETSEGARGLRVAIAHADTPARADALARMVGRERPTAELELVTTLGAVVGTHAGPGTVGLFWFSDPDS